MKTALFVDLTNNDCRQKIFGVRLSEPLDLVDTSYLVINQYRSPAVGATLEVYAANIDFQLMFKEPILVRQGQELDAVLGLLGYVLLD